METQTKSVSLGEILQFFDEVVKVQIITKYEARECIYSILHNILKNKKERDRFAQMADEEGTFATGLKTERKIMSRHRHQNSSWKPTKKKYRRKGQRLCSYNSIRRSIYMQTQTESASLGELFKYCDKLYKVNLTSKYEAKELIDSILNHILNISEKGLLSQRADEEGSLAEGLRVGKADESDHSVDILVNAKDIFLSDEPFMVEFEDDIDSNTIDQISSTFVDASKRYFPEKRRVLHRVQFPLIVPDGFVAVRLGNEDALKFVHCCIPRHSKERTWLLPYHLLNKFHMFVGNAVQTFPNVTLNKGVRGPAVSLTVLQDGGPNISVDITLKLTLPTKTLSVSDFGWPRHDTRKWLSGEKIDKVANTKLYLVPKGDKYWKISFASCEGELLKDIDNNKTCRKGCLRLMKKLFMMWQSQSQSGLKGLSSYLLKTTLLWLCEILPNDDLWYKNELSNRCLNFLQEFSSRLKKGSIGEYFNPSVNLLENKNQECIEELKEFVEDEILRHSFLTELILLVQKEHLIL